jgi:DNA polymerase, archaea type
MTVSGWLFDAYPLNDKMIIWIKTEDGRTIRLEDPWTCSIYVASDDKADLTGLTRNKAVQHYIKNHAVVQKYERITDHQKSTVLKLTVEDSIKATEFANTIEDIDVHDKFRLYNVDVLPPQSYFYEHGVFTLARCKVSVTKAGLQWELHDDVKSTNYELPDFKIMNLDVTLKQEGRLPRFTDKIDTITLRTAKETIEIQGCEAQALSDLMQEVVKIDPDFVFTRAGDEFVFPYLVERAQNCGIKLTLNREVQMPIIKPSEKGITYFSYGRVHYRPSTVLLYGRVHIDRHNSFILDHSALQGLYEIARICRMTLHTTARATIGRCLSSLQFYYAHNRDLLVPWKPATLEHDKSFKQLLIADRGGLILEPVIGVHERVTELDFVSLYPNIMRKYNISGETINCDCCPDSKNIAPEVNYRICEKRKGIVSEALAIPLDNRVQYKYLRKMATDDKIWTIYNSRQDSLKWIGVVSFGYLGHSNSKFGRIDAHIAVCAFARSILKKACRVVDHFGFNVEHAIVDSLFAKKENASYQHYVKLKEDIEQATGFDISYEGEYKWIALLSSKNNPMIPVPNRYFGVFQDGNVIKDRGIETRRHDTPPLFLRFQKEVLEIMAKGNNVKEVQALMPEVFDTFQKYKQDLKENKVSLVDLIFTKMISKNSDAYSFNTVETSALYQLLDEGESMRAGQTLQYIITDYYRKNRKKRTVPVELFTEKTTYDASRYIELLAEVCDSVTEPFGFNVEPWEGEVRQLI